MTEPLKKCFDGCRKEDPTVRVREEECDSCGRRQRGPTLCDACAVKYHVPKPAHPGGMYLGRAEDEDGGDE